MKLTLTGIFIWLSLSFFAQRTNPHQPQPGQVPNPEAFINTVEQSLYYFYNDYIDNNNYDSVIKALNYEPNQVPYFSDEVYCQRLAKMNEKTSFHLDCNPISLSTIRFFAAQRRGFAKIVLGRSALYFDMFQEKLTEHGLPIELRFLAVIESGLRPQVKSRAGALGLWQFMYKTGLYMGLEENTYVDDRMDPEKATEAACKYLKQLFNIYNDWNLALAAYNAGPGNVNRAIKRSGNKTTYWEVRPYLPAETQGYVPNFIAAAYLLTYHAEHNIVPMTAKVHNAHLDTLCLRDGLHFMTISKMANWEIEDIKELNPIYKTAFIPKSEKGRCLTGPLEKINLLAGVEDSLYKLEKSLYAPQPIVQPTAIQVVPQDTLNVSPEGVVKDSTAKTPQYEVVHVVKSRENLKSVALKYNVTIDQIMEWNKLRSTGIWVGQKLKVYTNEAPPVVEIAPRQTPPPVTKKYYSVRSGDTFHKIADRNNVTIAQLQKLNPGININRLTVGQQIRIK
ncbi:MAG: hypothetical protein RL264_340 [Bacteroidota bacterium]|jgi:membrane-bound lytic murein transglycosylase D